MGTHQLPALLPIMALCHLAPRSTGALDRLRTQSCAAQRRLWLEAHTPLTSMSGSEIQAAPRQQCEGAGTAAVSFTRWTVSPFPHKQSPQPRRGTQVLARKMTFQQNQRNWQ